MIEKYNPVPFDSKEIEEQLANDQEFKKAYDTLEEEYVVLNTILKAQRMKFPTKA